MWLQQRHLKINELILDYLNLNHVIEIISLRPPFYAKELNLIFFVELIQYVKYLNLFILTRFILKNRNNFLLQKLKINKYRRLKIHFYDRIFFSKCM